MPPVRPRRRRAKFGHELAYEQASLAAAPLTTAVRCPTEHRCRRCKAATRCCSARSAGRSGTPPPAKVRPEQGLLGHPQGARAVRQPAAGQAFDALLDASPLKPELLEGVDMLVVRELTGGIYFGERETQRRRRDAPTTRWPTPRPRSSASCASRFEVAAGRRELRDSRRQGQRARDARGCGARSSTASAERVPGRRARAPCSSTPARCSSSASPASSTSS